MPMRIVSPFGEIGKASGERDTLCLGHGDVQSVARHNYTKGGPLPRHHRRTV
jgi:hypothetical protein